jgi:hypothetical protein
MDASPQHDIWDADKPFAGLERAGLPVDKFSHA